MLRTLRIKNLGLVDDITLDLGPGFTTMTGETGAGKSMIIGALNLILGQRADRKLIRSGTTNCTVEAVFDIAPQVDAIEDFLEDNGLEPCEDDQLIIKRTVNANGSNKQFINHSPASLALLTSLGKRLVDIHGPYDHQSLFENQTQLRMLDAFAGLSDERETYKQLANETKSLQSQKEALITDEQTYAQQLDLLRFQTQEISAARLDTLDEETLEQEFQRARNASQIQELGYHLLSALNEGDDNLSEKCGQVGQALHQLQQLDPEAQDFVDLHVQISELVEDLQSHLSRYLDTVELEPEQLTQLETQINALQSLKRKYGGSIEEILAFGDRAARELALLESRDSEVERLDAQMATNLSKLRELGNALSRSRKAKGKKLGQATMEQLADLGFLESRFEANLSPDTSTTETVQSLRPNGIDRIEFLFGPNPGEPLHPLKKIASSGEIARVMLALKTVLAAEDSVPLLIFDEVDANIGGETAHAVGEKMRLLGQSHQVLCITHLAPVAAAADTHFQVTKSATGKRTKTELTQLTERERVGELARMLGGKLTEAKSHAKALLKSHHSP